MLEGTQKSSRQTTNDEIGKRALLLTDSKVEGGGSKISSMIRGIVKGFHIGDVDVNCRLQL